VSALTRRISRPSPALIVAIVALFMALGGTSYAALKITGNNVVNGTLSGADVDNRSLAGKEIKKNTLDGDEINESALGTVPMAAKAGDADTLGGNAASAFMTRQPRVFEAAIPANQNFANNAVVGTLADLAPGAYVVTAKLTYENDSATNTSTCTLHVPGGNDTTTFTHDTTNSETITLQKAVSSGAVFSPSVSCESDGSDDLIGVGNIIAVRVD
jgi:hypothetical protein